MNGVLTTDDADFTDSVTLRRLGRIRVIHEIRGHFFVLRRIAVRAGETAADTPW